MGLKGNLAVVNLADVFQMLSRGKSTGLLRVQAPEGTRFIEIQDGFISLAGRATQYIQLGDLLLARKAITDESLGTAMKIHKENGMVLGQVLIEMNYINKAALEDALRFLIEEEICDLFTLREGDFDFLANASLDTKIAPGGGAVRLKIDPDSLLLEAARRADEWHELEQRIVTQSLLFRLTDEGMRVYKDADSISDEGRVIMRLLQANQTVEGIVQKSCLGRLNTNRMILELWDAQLIEPIPKTEYLNFAKLQIEAGQIADAHRMAVHASKVGSPDQIKAAIPLIDTLRRQLVTDDKPLVSQPSEKKGSSPAVKKAVVANLIIKRRRLPWAKIAIIAVILLGGGGTAAAYFMRGDNPHAAGVKTLESLKRTSSNLIGDRKFAEALSKFKGYSPPDADLKAEHEKYLKQMQLDIDTQLTQDITEFTRKKDTSVGVTRADLEKIKKQMADYDGIAIVNPSALKSQVRYKKDLPDLEDKIRVAEFRSRLDLLRKNSKELTPDQVADGYRELLKGDPPEIIAREARAELFKLRAPSADAQRQLALARELLEKGDYVNARAKNEAIKSQYASTLLAQEADKNLKELADRETKAAEELAKIQKLILQRKGDEARAAAATLMGTNPPAHILSDARAEIRKLQSDVPEEELKQSVRAAVASWDIDPRQARAKILDIVNTHPFSEAAASAVLKVRITSTPDGALVNYKDKSGKTPVTLELPAMGPILLTFTLPGFEPQEKVECNFRGDKIPVVFIRKPQVAVLAPIAAEAGMIVLNDALLLAGGTEVTVCNPRTLDVLRRVNLEGTPLPAKIADKTVTQPALAKGELKLRALSMNTEDAEPYAFASCSGPYFFQIPINGTEFHRIPCEPGAVGEPQMYRPKKATSSKLISLVSRAAIDIYSSERQKIENRLLPNGNGADKAEIPFGFAFDGDTYYLPRDNNTLYAVEGYRGDLKWKKQCEARISVPPAVIRELNLLGVADVKGRITIYDTDSYGKDKGHSDLESGCPLGLAAAPNGFVAACEDNRLAYVNSAGGPPVWYVQLSGKILFTPLIYVPDKKARNAVPAAIACYEAANGGFTIVAVSLADGSLLWHGRMASKPLAGAVGPDAVYISTVDCALLKFDHSSPTN